MKKILSIILSVAMLSSAMLLTSCGKTADTTADGDKVLTMATNAYFPPYEFYDGDKIVGIDAEIADAIAKKLGMTLKIEDVEFDSVLAGVQSGKYDMGAAGITVTPDREKSMDFTDSYAKGVQVVIVKENSPITSVDDLSANENYQVGVQLSTTGDIYASSPVDEGGFGEARVQKFQSGNDAVAALVSDKVDCVIIDNEPAKAYVASNTGLKILETTYADEDYAICTAKGSDLTEPINTAIKELKADGTIDSIISKYIPAE